MGLEAVGIAEHGPRLFFAGVPRRRWPQLAGPSGKGRGSFSTSRPMSFPLEGDLDVPAEILPHLDMLLVGLHPRVTLRGWTPGGPFTGCAGWPCSAAGSAIAFTTPFTLALVRCVGTAAGGHRGPSGLRPAHRQPGTGQGLRPAGTLLEINCRHARACAPDIQLAAQVKEVSFVLGSDAHSPQEVGRFEAGYQLVRQLGLDRERIVNVDWRH